MKLTRAMKNFFTQNFDLMLSFILCRMSEATPRALATFRLVLLAQPLSRILACFPMSNGVSKYGVSAASL